MTTMSSITTRFVSWIDEKIIWNRYKFMRWYCTHLLHARCTEIGENLRLAEFVKRPVIQGGGEIRLGRDITIVGPLDLIANSTVFPDCQISIGDGTIIGRECSIRAKQRVVIGKNCLLAPYVRIYDHSGHPLDPRLRLTGTHEAEDQIEEVVIGDNVWIAEFAHIQKGVKIGAGSIVGAHSVVVSDVPENSIVFGIPAKKILWLQDSGTSQK